ncbi:unnamed protein product [Ixodes persulcatus]
MELERMTMLLAIEKEKTKQIELQMAPERREGPDSGAPRKNRLDHFAKKLKSLLTPIPSDPEVPVWLDGIEGIFSSYRVPDEVKSHLILPLVTGRIRHLFSKLSTEELDDYSRVKETIMSELRLSPGEYLRQFRGARKNRNESWQHCASRLTCYFSYYMEAHEVKSRDDLAKLVVADHLKATLSREAYKYVKHQEGTGWSAPGEMAKLIEAFEDAEGKGAAVGRDTRPKPNDGPHEENSSCGRENQLDPLPPPHAGEKKSKIDRPPLACFLCGKGHFARECPERGQQRKEVRVDGPRKVDVRSVGLEAATPPVDRTAVTANGSRVDETKPGLANLPQVEIQCGSIKISAIVDTGAEITVVRNSLIPGDLIEEAGEINLVSAFGDKVTAKLANIAFRLVRAGGGQSDVDRSVALLCAVTEKLSPGADCLLSGEAWDMLNEATALPPDQSGESEAVELRTNRGSETDPTEGEALGRVLGL